MLGAGRSGVAAAELARRSCDAVYVLDEGAPAKLEKAAAAMEKQKVAAQ